MNEEHVQEPMRITYERIPSPLSSQVSILHLNACSLRNKLDDLEAEIQVYNFPNVIVVCESRLTEGITPFFNVQGYTSYHTTRKDGYGGLSIFVKSTISHRVVTDISTIDRVHISKVKLDQVSMNLFCVYRAPRSDISRFLDQLDDILEENSNVILCGDMNLNLYDANDTYVSRYKLVVESNAYKFLNSLERDQFSYPITSGPGSPGSLIDHYVTDMIDKEYYLTNAPSIGDHHCLFLRIRSDTFSRTERSMMMKHNPRIISDLKNYLERTHNESLMQIHNEMRNITERNTFLIRLPEKVNFPWIDREILQEIKKKNLFYQETKNPRLSLLQRNTRRNLYKLQKNKVTAIVRKKRNLFVHHNVQEAMHNPKRMWQAMRLALNKKAVNNKEDIPEVIEDPNGTELNDPKQILNALNHHFTTIGDKLNQEQQARKNNLPRIPGTQDETQESLHLFKTNQQELSSIIVTLKNDAAAGLDGIGVKNLKATSRELSRALIRPINQCLNEGTFPSSFKQAKVKALYKGTGSKKKPGNYRPISVLCNLSKILEKLIYQRISNFLRKNDIISTKQFGFLEKSNTTTAALHAITKIKQSLEDQLQTGAVFIDIAKAFDSVKHELLLQKLKKNGIRGKAHNLVQDYLFGRNQIVAATQIESDKLFLKSGVPQGSSLSSLLFLVYINDLCSVDLHAHLQLYADDAILIYSDEDDEQLKTNIQEDLTRIDTWLYGNYLTFNATKTKLIHFKKSSQDSHQPLNVIVNGTLIEEVTDTKFLGLIIDSELSWKQHHQFLTNRLKPQLFIFRRTRYSVPVKTKLSLYYAYFQSHISYLITIWGYCNVSMMNKLQVLQNKAIRYLFWQQYRSNGLSTQQLMSIHNIPTITQLRTITSMTLIHKIRYNQIRNNLQLKTFQQQHDYNTRNKTDFILPRTRTNLLHNSLLATGLSNFNKLPDRLKREVNFRSFKIALRTYVLAPRT